MCAYQLEICANSVTSALIAQEAGADRVEFCQNLEVGGTTPSYGQISIARSRLKIGMHVLIRPRAGDFLYTAVEYEEMKADIHYCKEAKCNGVVIGLLHANGMVDTERTAELVRLAQPLHVTFHRAFDVCRDPFEALEAIIASGCQRLLTSGMENSALAGAVLIKSLIERADGRIEIMPGAGINEANIAEIASITGAKSFHASAKTTRRSAMTHVTQKVGGMGGELWESSNKKIRLLADILKNI